MFSQSYHLTFYLWRARIKRYFFRTRIVSTQRYYLFRTRVLLKFEWPAPLGFPAIIVQFCESRPQITSRNVLFVQSLLSNRQMFKLRRQAQVSKVPLHWQWACFSVKKNHSGLPVPHERRINYELLDIRLRPRAILRSLVAEQYRFSVERSCYAAYRYHLQAFVQQAEHSSDANRRFYFLSSESYEVIREVLSDFILECRNGHSFDLSPSFIMKDKDQALQRACTELFPRSTSLSCYYHLRCNLQTKYRNNSDILTVF